MKAPTPEQAHILRHALGLAAPVRRGRPPRRPYRNHYCAPQGHENIPAIEALIALGWMEKAGADTYRVTLAGKAQVLDGAELEEAAERVLAVAFRGIHHVPYWDRRRLDGRTLLVSHYGGLATFDFDELTRLVVAAHDHHVRVVIASAGPRMLRLGFSLRKREGEFWERHPDMETAVAAARSGR